MKKLLILIMALMMVSVANAEGHRYNNSRWVAPAIIGGVAGGIIINEMVRPKYYMTPPPIVYQVPPPVQQPITVCPYPYNAQYTTIWIVDSNGHQIPVQQFAGCR